MNAESPSAVSRYVHRVADPEYQAAAEAAEQTLAALLPPQSKASAMHALLCNEAEAHALWEMANYTAVAKLGFTDHGPIHAHMAAAAAVQILHLLLAAGHTPDIVRAGVGDVDDAFVIVLAGALLHDVGNALTRGHQSLYGVILAQPLLRRVLPQVYDDPGQRTRVLAAILSTIATHGTDPAPVTLEGSIVAVADATDITSGRGRISFAAGKIDIHAISALSIRNIAIKPIAGQQPIAIEVDMSGEAGIFQVEQTLVRKLLRTTLRDQVAVRACIYGPDSRQSRLIDCVALNERNLKAVPA